MPPFLTIPLLITPFNNAVNDWLQRTVSRGLPLAHPPLNNLSILIAGTKCSQGGLGLPLHFLEMAPHGAPNDPIKLCQHPNQSIPKA